MNKIYLIFLVLVFVHPVMGVSSGVDVRTNVTSSGNSNVEVDTTVSSTSNSTSGTSVSKRSKITVNGKKQVFESNKEGTTEINVTSNGNEVTTTTKHTDVKENGSASISPKPSLIPSINPIQFDVFKYAKQTTFQEYIMKNLIIMFNKIFRVK